MLIKLSSDTNLHDISRIDIHVGCKFLRYFYEDCYNIGVVIAYDGSAITVDFDDTIYEYLLPTVTYVFGTAHGEHLMTCCDGKIIKDFRSAPSPTVKIDNLEDLLDFDKWMV